MTTRSDLPLAAMASAVLAAGPVAACSMPEETAMAAKTPIPAPAPALPQETTQAVALVEEVYGLWAIRAVEGDAGCRVSLSAQRDGAAYGALMERCTIAGLDDAKAWKPAADGFEVLGPDGTALMRFRMTGVDAFESVDGRFRGTRSPEM